MDAEIIYPVTIVLARYGGTYEGGKWLAFPLDHFDLPGDWQGGDSECNTFWQNYPNLVGKGKTPDEAHQDLISKQ